MYAQLGEALQLPTEEMWLLVPAWVPYIYGSYCDTDPKLENWPCLQMGGPWRPPRLLRPAKLDPGLWGSAHFLENAPTCLRSRWTLRSPPKAPKPCSECRSEGSPPHGEAEPGPAHGAGQAGGPFRGIGFGATESSGHAVTGASYRTASTKGTGVIVMGLWELGGP